MSTAARYPNRLDSSGKPAKPEEAALPAYQINWEERLEPKKMDWAEGVSLVGVLIGLERRNMRDQKSGAVKSVARYIVRELDDPIRLTYHSQPWFFFGTYVLDSALQTGDIGHFVEITCTGEDKDAGRNGNAMKTFKVRVAKNKAPGFANDGTPITDDDLPPMDAYK